MYALLIICVTTRCPSAARVSLLGQANSDTVPNRSVLNGGVRARMRLHGTENTAPSVSAASAHRSSTHLSLPASTGSCFLQESCRSPLNLPYPIQPERTVDICSVGRVVFYTCISSALQMLPVFSFIWPADTICLSWFVFLEKCEKSLDNDLELCKTNFTASAFLCCLCIVIF